MSSIGATVTIAFFDSSAFLKLLIDEPGRDEAVRMWDESDVVAASRLALAEVSAAIAAARRAARLDAGSERRARADWADYWAAAHVVDMTAAVATAAAKLAERLVLGGADAVQLSSALTVAAGGTVLVTWDRRLADAAIECGLAVAPGLEP